MNNKKAFSLVEAMVILLLISIAIMVLIPLISQKKVGTRWIPIKNNAGTVTAINYGNEPIERVGIGEGANPYDDDAPASKLAVKTLGIKTGSIPATSILWSDNYEAFEFQKTNNHTNSMVFGVNSTENDNSIINNSIVIKSNDAPTAPTNSIEIGNNINAAVNDTLTISSGGNAVIQVSDNSFSFSSPTSPTGTTVNSIMSYSGGDTTTKGTLEIGNDGNGTLKIGTTGTDILTINGNYSLIPDGAGGNTCSSYFKSDTSAATYCTWASDEGWVYSDKRLKNIISKYTKNQTELDKIDTYKFTYKSDKKKRLHTGVIAQKLIGIFDEALHIDDKGYYSIEREPMFYAMINSAKDFMNEYKNIKKTQQKNIKKADKLLRKYQ